MESQTNLNHIFRMFIRRSMIICYQLTCYLLTCNQPHLLSAWLAIPSFAINSLAICFTRSWPHLHSGLTCSRHTCYPASLALATLAIQPHFLSGQFAIRPHLLSKRLLSSLNCYQCASAIQNYQNTLLSKLVVS